MLNILANPKVGSVVSHQCEYGLLTPDKNGIPKPAMKPTRWASSSPRMLQRLSKRCTRTHEHQHLTGGRAEAAAFYPTDLLLAILRGMRDEADAKHDVDDNVDVTDGCTKLMQLAAAQLSVPQSSSWAKLCATQTSLAAVSDLKTKFKHVNGTESTINYVFKDRYVDEYTGEELPLAETKAAIANELDYFCQHVWVGADSASVYSTPESKTIPSRWVFCNKGDSETPDVRARLVGCEINTYKDDSFYASTPPLDAKRMLFSDFSTRRTDSKGRMLKLSFVDVVKAYFNALQQRKIFVRLPKEMGQSSGVYGKLVRCMYGTRDAAHLWENCYSEALVKIGFVAGRASPCCFYHSAWEVSVVVHGDDFTALGCAKSLDLYENGLKQHFEIKLRGKLGTEKSDDKEIRILNRIVKITSTGLTYEADPRHVEMLARDMGMDEGKSVVTPGIKEPYEAEEEVTEYDVHPEADAAIHKLMRPPKSTRTRPVQFDENVVYHDVVPYSELYGAHPKYLVNTRRGFLQRAKGDRDPFTSKNAITMARRRREKTYGDEASRHKRARALGAALRDGAKLEIPSST